MKSISRKVKCHLPYVCKANADVIRLTEKSSLLMSYYPDSRSIHGWSRNEEGTGYSFMDAKYFIIELSRLHNFLAKENDQLRFTLLIYKTKSLKSIKAMVSIDFKQLDIESALNYIEHLKKYAASIRISNYEGLGCYKYTAYSIENVFKLFIK